MHAPIVLQLTEDLHAHIAEEAAASGFSSVEEFIQDLIKKHCDGTLDLDELEAAIIEGEQSGAPILADEAFWKAKHARLREQSQRRAR